MHLFKHARVPLACLPTPLNEPTGAPGAEIEPWRECDIAVEGNRIVSVKDSSSTSDGSTFFSTKVTDLGGQGSFDGFHVVLRDDANPGARGKKHGDHHRAAG